MNARTRGLGRGLGALLPSGPARLGTDADPLDGAGTRHSDAWTLPAVEASVRAATGHAPGAYFEELSLDSIGPNPRQPRRSFDDGAMAELVHSIREIGLLQPIVVRPVGPSRYELVVGERRWRAAREAGLGRIPAIIRDTGDDAMLRNALLENLHREQLNPLEEAAAYDQLLKDFGATHEELADRIGRSRAQVTNTIRLLRLPRRCSGAWLPACSARATRARSSPSPTVLARNRWRRASLPKACQCVLSRRSSRSEIQIPPRRPLRNRPRDGATAPGLDDLAGKLSDHFETRVKVELGRRRGKIIVEFASLDDLERIVAAMAPGTARTRDDARRAAGRRRRLTGAVDARHRRPCRSTLSVPAAAAARGG